MSWRFCSCHSPADEDLSFPQHADDLFWGVSFSGHGLASIVLTVNPNLRLGPVFGGKVSLVHHSDRGVQYTSNACTSLLKQHGIRISMGRRGNPYDNAKAESFFKTLKYEEVYL